MKLAWFLSGGTTISDSKGNIYAVDADGYVTQVGVSGGSNNAEMQLVFSDYEEEVWAFNTWRAEYAGKTLVESEYEDINSYKVPWKLVSTGKSGTGKVKVQKGDIDLSRVVFKTPHKLLVILRKRETIIIHDYL